MLVSSAVIFRQRGGAERMEIPIREGDWERIRVRVDDRRSEAVPFTGLRVALAERLLPLGRAIDRAVGVGLAAWGVWLLGAAMP